MGEIGMDRKTLAAKLIRLGSLEVDIFRKQQAMRDSSELEAEVDEIRTEILDVHYNRTEEVLKRFFADPDNFPELVNALEHQILDLQQRLEQTFTEVSDKIDRIGRL